ncbi:hypothetical protein J4Q44_G00219930 [Coregonus suidteri]|uniref:Uncharacterized protein n=1 Tax=Coregonus suidteri TaxID=861788 RepID=A0AAN8QKW6_9TELE
MSADQEMSQATPPRYPQDRLEDTVREELSQRAVEGLVRKNTSTAREEEPVVDLMTTESFSTETDVTRCADETAILGPEKGPNDICTRDEPDMDIVCPQHVQTETFTIQTDRKPQIPKVAEKDTVYSMSGASGLFQESNTLRTQLLS